MSETLGDVTTIDSGSVLQGRAPDETASDGESECVSTRRSVPASRNEAVLRYVRAASGWCTRATSSSANTDLTQLATCRRRSGASASTSSSRCDHLAPPVGGEARRARLASLALPVVGAPSLSGLRPFGSEWGNGARLPSTTITKACSLAVPAALCVQEAFDDMSDATCSTARAISHRGARTLRTCATCSSRSS